MIRTSTHTGNQASRAGTPPEAQDESPEESGRTAGRRVLVADDNHDSAESLGMLLEMAGHEVRLAYDGQEALESAGHFLPDVMLLDIGLPKLDGFEVASRLRRDSRHDRMLLVAVTGYGTDSDRERARAAGFDHHLMKPVDPRALSDLIAGS
jgi:CheY-like chemotaxis protein